MRAEIISIGTEILLGEITDTNAAFIASRLPEHGIDLLWVTQVGDNPGRLGEAIRRAWERSEITFATGGLGPTEDDLTREAVATALGEELRVDAEQERILRARMEARGRPRMPQRNIKQATLIPSARPLPNSNGTAPGWWVEREGAAMVLMPGPPAEMQPMWEQQVAPELERRASAVLVLRTLKTTGLGESAVNEALLPLLAGANPSIGLYGRADGVHIRISAKAATREQARALIRPAEEEARRILGRSVWGEDEETLPAAVGRMLREAGLTLAVMESATGGAIGDAITDFEGSSEYFRGSLVTYATETKLAMGVPAEVIAAHGVISRETAEAMAGAARERFDADLGIGLTGVAGEGEVEGQPPGTVHIALSDGERVEYAQMQFRQGRPQVKRRAVLQALSLLREYLLGRGEGT